jgi:glycosyltransferase involved in cell wall biosynthesis
MSDAGMSLKDSKGRIAELPVLPLVSIGMPLYNEERHLRGTLDSLLAQDYANFELIISDNASEDATEAICRDYAARDCRIQYYRNESNLGALVNFSQVLRWSKGKYFIWAAGHDRHAPALIRKCVEALEREPEAVLCATWSKFINLEIQPTGTELRVIDTRGRGAFSRFNVAAWAQSSNYAIYGLIRHSALADCRPPRLVVRPDSVLLSELALLGPFIVLPEQLFFPLDKWGNLTPEQYKVRLEVMLRDLAPGKNRHARRFLEWHHAVELARGALHSRVCFWLKPLLVASALATYFVFGAADLGFGYRSLPSFIRVPMKTIFQRLLGLKNRPRDGREEPTT